MKRSVYYGSLAAMAVLSAAAALAQADMTPGLQNGLAVPFAQIGLGLRMLSLSGTAGNIAALILYFVLSLFPIILLPVICRRRRLAPEDGLLAVLSVLLFAVLYIMINPGVMTRIFGTSAVIPMGKAMLGGMVWSVIAGYGVLRILRMFFAADRMQLQRYFSAFLYVLALLCIWIACGTQLSALFARISAVYAANQGTEDGLFVTCIFLVLRYLGAVLPYVLGVIVLEAAIRLLALQRSDPDTPHIGAAADRLSVLCGKSVAAAVVTNIGINLLQLLCAGFLRDIHGNLELPVFSVGLVLAVLLLARYIAENARLRAENRRLQDDNDLFI